MGHRATSLTRITSANAQGTTSEKIVAVGYGFDNYTDECSDLSLFLSCCAVVHWCSGVN